ncbi:MAG TPA: hypothetical protein VLM37_04590 [Fibrobacteraceae bacterium]|nr:hypothetical protein [Fibrobacteraceae bacterium]
MFHRTEVVADLRANESQKQVADARQAHDATRRDEIRKENTVEATDEIVLDPDAQEKQDSDHQPPKKRKRPSPSASNSDDRADEEEILHHNLGAGHVDLQA